jgi:hypothetical protein
MHVHCPACSRAIELAPHEVGLTVECAVCGRRFGTKRKAPRALPAGPSPLPLPELPQPELPQPLPQEVHWHFTHVTAVQAPPRFEEESPQRRTDAPGMISLVFGCVAGAFLLMAPVFCGLTVGAAAPLALIGLILAFFARGNLRVGALTLNLLVFVFALVGAVIGFVALASVERLGRP